MSPSRIKALIDESETLLAAVRSGVLLHFQNGVLPSHLDAPLEFAREVHVRAQQIDNQDLVLASETLVAWLALLAAETDTISHTRASSILDQVAELEAILVAVKARSDTSPIDVGEFIEESFDVLRGPRLEDKSTVVFDEAESDVDNELAEIFREEAEALLRSMRENLERFRSRPEDRESLWEVKRGAHTFKGVAGVVGLSRASEMAHRIEDLLDRASATENQQTFEGVGLILEAVDCLKTLTDGASTDQDEKRFDAVFRSLTADATVEASREAIPPPTLEPPFTARTEPPKPTPIHNDIKSKEKARIVRVSLDRVDDLTKHLKLLVKTGATLVDGIADLESQLEESRNNYLRLQAVVGKISAAQFTSGGSEPQAAHNTRQTAYELAETTGDASVINTELASLKRRLDDLHNDQRTLIDAMQERLIRLRKVEFGTISNRLRRTVSVTSDEDGKRAEVVIPDPHFEVDSQVIESLLEPLMHLLKNAVVHGIEPPETRRLLGKPEIGRITVSVMQDRHDVILNITDDGRGIAFQPLLEKAISSGLVDHADVTTYTPDRLKDLLFMPGLTTAEKITLNAGRGVGMSIVRESVVAMKGTIDLTTKPQFGTTFTIRVPQPFVERRRPSRTHLDQTLDVNDAKIVLIVDDSPSVRLKTSRFFRGEGWRSETAANGFEALEKLRLLARLPDAILSDIEMPIMGGYEFVGALRADELLKEIPVVFISSRSGEGERDRALAAGVNEYFTKPCDDRELLEAVEQLRVASVPA